MLIVLYTVYRNVQCRKADCRYVSCRYAECRYAKKRYAECRDILMWACIQKTFYEYLAITLKIGAP
jgi:hypothetical protein